MDFRQIRYFVSVAQSGSFSRASMELRIAQPALSSQIAALEAELEAQLFVRHSRGVDMTAAGRVLLARAVEILVLLDGARAEVKALGSNASCEVRLGLPTTTTGMLTIPLMDEFALHHPEVVLHIVEGMTGHLEKWLEQDDIDVAMLYDRPNGNGRPFMTSLGRERLTLLGHANEALSRQEAVRFADISALPLIHTTRAHQLRRMLDDYSMSTRVPLNLVAEIDSLAQIKTLLFSSRGYTILPESISLDWKTADIRSWPIVAPELHLRHYVVPSPRFQRQPHAEEVLNVITTVTRRLISAGLWLGATLDEADHPDAETLVAVSVR